MIRRLGKWTAILFIILLLLAVLGDKDKKKDRTEAGTVFGTFVESKLGGNASEDIPGDASKFESTLQVISGLLDDAIFNVKNLKLISPLGDNAYEKYQIALNGLGKIVDEYIQLMDKALVKGVIDNARSYLTKDVNISPNHYGMIEAKESITAASC